MRIIAGFAKGRKLFEVPGKNTRSLTDRAKESLFSILMPIIIDANVLDLYAGSSSFSLEAISRGARRADAVDNFGLAIETSRKNIDKVDFGDYIDLVRANVISFCRGIVREERNFDIIFADPPFPAIGDKKSHFYSITPMLGRMLSDDGKLIVRVHCHAEHPMIDGLEMYREHKVGISMLLFYRHVKDKQ